MLISYLSASTHQLSKPVELVKFRHKIDQYVWTIWVQILWNSNPSPSHLRLCGKYEIEPVARPKIVLVCAKLAVLTLVMQNYR